MTEKEFSIKKEETLYTIKPLMRCFGIKDFDYQQDEKGNEVLVIEGTKINCSFNSCMATKIEALGYIIINFYCKHRSLGQFQTQTQNIIMKHWQK
ncbi:MAG: hypothetical protein ACRCZB_04890 [Bacteroidales bacterium]